MWDGRLSILLKTLHTECRLTDLFT